VTGYNRRVDDTAFLRALQRGTYPKEEMNHRAHLRLALLLRDDPHRAAGILRVYATSVGQAARYNETLTLFWMRAAAHHGGTVDEAMSSPLADKDLPLRHYSEELLWSDAAREGWVEPDLRPLPF
jgi:hypothetical protein